MTDELLTTPALEIPATDVPAESTQLPRQRSWLRFAVAFLAALIAALALGAGALYAYDRHYQGRILPGVRVGSLDLSGLTAAEAKARLAETYSSFGQGKAVLRSPQLQITINYADIGRRADVDAMANDAMAIGRNGNAADRIVSDARTLLHSVQLEPRVTFDGDKLANAIKSQAASLDVPATNAKVALSKAGFNVVPGVAGKQADHLGPTEFLTMALARTDAPAELKLDLKVAPLEPTVTTAIATDARAAADLIAKDVSITQGKEAWTIPAATVRSWITFGIGADGRYGPIVDSVAVNTALASLAKTIEQKPKDATFITTGGTVYNVTPGKNGRSLDTVATAQRILTLLDTRAAGGTSPAITPALIVKPPSLTTEAAAAAAPKMRKISSWTTYFFVGEKNGFGANIWIPALDINGAVVPPGGTFDFWKGVGPISRAHGYRTGGAIINGKTEPQGALAGGICSCSTTLFNAALRAGFKMGARANHYYYIDRYPLGLDATVFISASGSKQTMSWTNDTAYPVLIRGYKIPGGAKGYVRFELYSVPTGRTVSFSTPIVKNVRPAWDTTQYTTSLPAGSSKRIEFPVDGKDVWVTRTVRDAAGRIIHQETYYSHYARITGVLLIGKG